MLVGQYDYAIDAKGRLNFPARFRDAMGETFIVTRWLDHCLAAFPAEEFEKVAAKIEEKGLVKGRKVSRMLYASAVEVTPGQAGPHSAARQAAGVRGPRPRCDHHRQPQLCRDLEHRGVERQPGNER